MIGPISLRESLIKNYFYWVCTLVFGLSPTSYSLAAGKNSFNLPPPSKQQETLLSALPAPTDQQERSLSTLPTPDYAININPSDELQPLPIHDLQPILLDVTINKSHYERIVECYIDKQNHAWVSESDLRAWRLSPPPQLPLQYDGKRYYLLNWYNGLHYVIDIQALTMSINTPLNLLPITSLKSRQEEFLIPGIRPKQPGLFLNYDATVLNTDTDLHQTSEAALTEEGFFTPLGVASNQLLLQNSQVNGPDAQTAVRLDTTWTLDQPEHIATLRLGDSITSALDWGGAVRFGGIQYSTNFSTQPNLVTFPTPSIRGVAAIPSNVDLLVNGNKLINQAVPSGSFVIEDIPVVSGGGTMQVVTKNILGQTEVMMLPYYASPQLLKPGLDDYSYQIGFARNNYGINSFDYSDALAVGTYSRGITDHLTAGGQVEAELDQQTIGSTLNYLWKTFGVFTLGGAASQRQGSYGALGEAGFTRQQQTLSFGVREVFATHDFVQIGLADNQRSPSLMSQAFAGLSLPKMGTLSSSYTILNGQDPFESFDSNNTIEQDNTVTPVPVTSSTQLVTVSYNRGLFKQAALYINGTYDVNNNQTSVFGSITWTFNQDKIVQLNSNYSADRVGGFAQITKNLPSGLGYGYNLAGGAGATPVAGGFAVNAPIGTYSANYSRIYGKNTYEVDGSGSAVYFDRSARLTRDNYQQSFALVEVPGFAHVRVYYRNSLMGRTNKDGKLFVPNLLPYQNNDIQIEPKDLPMNATIGEIKKTVIPYYRSGIIVRFDVIRTHAATMQLQTPKYQDAPPLTEVSVNGQSYYVGYDGLLDLNNLKTNAAHASAIINGSRCEFDVTIPESKNDSIPDLGVVICQPTTPNTH